MIAGAIGALIGATAKHVLDKRQERGLAWDAFNKDAQEPIRLGLLGLVKFEHLDDGHHLWSSKPALREIVDRGRLESKKHPELGRDIAALLALEVDYANSHAAMLRQFTEAQAKVWASTPIDSMTGGTKTLQDLRPEGALHDDLQRSLVLKNRDGWVNALVYAPQVGLLNQGYGPGYYRYKDPDAELKVIAGAVFDRLNEMTSIARDEYITKKDALVAKANQILAGLKQSQSTRRWYASDG